MEYRHFDVVLRNALTAVALVMHTPYKNAQTVLHCINLRRKV